VEPSTLETTAAAVVLVAVAQCAPLQAQVQPVQAAKVTRVATLDRLLHLETVAAVVEPTQQEEQGRPLSPVLAVMASPQQLLAWHMQVAAAAVVKQVTPVAQVAVVLVGLTQTAQRDWRILVAVAVVAVAIQMYMQAALAAPA
jgi:hypothetical protein